jgi:AcrR family transcriptional regulator
MNAKTRRERERQALREQILDAAREMFATHGVEATTMRAIARKIDYTPTALYYHFKDKDALITEICHRDFRRLAHQFVQLGRVDDPVERIRWTGRAYVEFGLENPQHYRMMFMTTHTHDTDVPEKNNPEEDAYAFLRVAVQEAMAAGRFRPEFQDADAMVQMLWAALHGVVSLHVAKQHDNWVEWRDPRETADALTTVLLRGVLRESAG